MRFLASLFLSALVSVSISASLAQTDAPGPPAPPVSNAPVVEMARFCARPAEKLRYYPPKALGRHVSGRAVLDCSIGDDGHMRGCQVVEETPASYGFGEAGLGIACKFHIDPAATSDARKQIYERDGVRHMRTPFEWRLND